MVGCVSECFCTTVVGGLLAWHRSLYSLHRGGRAAGTTMVLVGASASTAKTTAALAPTTRAPPLRPFGRTNRVKCGREQLVTRVLPVRQQQHSREQQRQLQQRRQQHVARASATPPTPPEFDRFLGSAAGKFINRLGNFVTSSPLNQAKVLSLHVVDIWVCDGHENLSATRRRRA